LGTDETGLFRRGLQDALLVAQPTASKHSRVITVNYRMLTQRKKYEK